MKTQNVGPQGSSCGADDAFATHRATDTLKIYFFANGTATLQPGYISVTPNVCEEGVGISPINDSSDQNRRLRCPRASKQSPSSASLQSSQLAAASKKKKLLLLSQLLQSQATTSTNIFAGRASRYAPQNPSGQTASTRPVAESLFSKLDLTSKRARASSWRLRYGWGSPKDVRAKVSTC